MSAESKIRFSICCKHRKDSGNFLNETEINTQTFLRLAIWNAEINCVSKHEPIKITRKNCNAIRIVALPVKLKIVTSKYVPVPFFNL